MPRKLEWDWHDGEIPDNVLIHDEAYVETSQSFELFRSTRPQAIRLGRGASIYPPTMFDLGPDAQVEIGEFTMLNGPRIICDGRIDIGSHCFISWNVVLLDCRRWAFGSSDRRRQLRKIAQTQGLPRRPDPDPHPSPIIIGSNVWIGFDAIILPGVRIGDGSIIGARSVVERNVDPCTIVAGNPARVIRTLDASR